ncbi:hypothetical protein AVEN_183241-1, partial [Araneus ventricosus]
AKGSATPLAERSPNQEAVPMEIETVN